MRRGKSWGLAGAIVFALLFSAGEAQGKQMTAYASGKASNGYAWTIYAKNGRHGDRIELSVGREGGVAVYVDTRPAKVNRKRIKADFGDLGRINLRFHTLAKDGFDFPGCKVSDRFGRFRGMIRFTGEGGYAAVRRQSTPGDVSLSRGCGAAGPIFRQPEADPSSFLFSCGPEPDTALLAFEDEASSPTFFLGVTYERTGDLEIYRQVFAEGTARNLKVGKGRRTAEVRPPQPFLGRPSYQGGFLDGRLRAMFPGEGLTYLAPGPARLTSGSDEGRPFSCVPLRGLMRTHTRGAAALARALAR